MDGIRLYDYQIDMQNRIDAAFGRHRSVMAQMPTGTGKTYLLASFVCGYLSKSQGEVWIVAHRRELVEQTERSLFALASGLPMPGIDADIAQRRVRVVSIQWLQRNFDRMDAKPELVVIDEAHHALARTYREMWTRYPDAKFLGLTATPCRLDGSGFTDLFEVLVESFDIPSFIMKGRLAVYDFVSIRPDSQAQRLIDSLKKRGADGDYQQKEMNLVLNKRPGIEQLYSSYDEFAAGRKGIVYAINIDHARKIAQCYKEHGVEAAAIDSHTPPRERGRLISLFKAGGLEVLVNVDIFSEGFDCPDVEFVQLARPTLSLAKYLQMVGRGLRVTEGKRCCMLIDNVGLYRVFGLPSQSWNWPAMFEGRMCSGDLRREASISIGSLSPLMPSCYVEGGRNDEMMLVVSHEDLQEVFDIQKLGEELSRRRCLLLSGGMGPILHLGHQLVGLLDTEGRVSAYFDLTNMRQIVPKAGSKDREPQVVKVGRFEFVRYAGKLYTRTLRVWQGECGRNISNSVTENGFYACLLLPDEKFHGNRVRGNKVLPPEPSQAGYACVLENDGSDCYWYCGRLADGSIIVCDRRDRYYLAEAGKTKVYVAGGSLAATTLEDVLPRLVAEAQKHLQAKEVAKKEKRSRLLDSLKFIMPFKMGLKWGLRGSDGRILVPPLYKYVSENVHGLFAFEQNYNQWGVMNRDGKILVEPRYERVEIKDGSTVIVTNVTGKTEVKTLN